MEKLEKLVEELEAEKETLKKRYKLAKAGKPLPEPESESEEEQQNEDGTPKKKKAKKSLPSDPARIKKAIEKLDERIKNRKVEIEQKDELKTIALGTSKINYMDPRITAAWCKKHDVRSSLACSPPPVRGSCGFVADPLCCVVGWGNRCRSRRSSRRPCETSSPGPWTSMPTSSTEVDAAGVLLVGLVRQNVSQ
jgi:hypothetical protein